MGLFLLWERNELVRLGYEIQQLQERQKELKQVNRQLLVEISSLSSYSRVEQIALTRLGMIRPDPHQVVVVQDPPTATPEGRDEPIRLAREGDSF